MTQHDVTHLVAEAGARAHRAAPTLAAATDAAITAALHAMADQLSHESGPVLEANAQDLSDLDPSFPEAMRDRLRLDADRLEAMAGQIRVLAEASFPDPVVSTRDLPGGFRLEERRRPVGVIGAVYEARPNVTVDVASQLLKSRNAGVLRTGRAALGSAMALQRHVVEPALRLAGLDAHAVQVVDSPDREGARALVSMPAVVPLVIIRGSGDTTRELGAHAAAHGVRTLAHADGGGVMYVDRAADLGLVAELVTGSLDRLGVCNRLNLLLIHEDVWDGAVRVARAAAAQRGVELELPPHDHALGREWALDEGNEAHVTVAPVGSAVEAAVAANGETSGLAATIVTEDRATAERFIAAYAGTGAFWNASTRLLDGFKLLGAPETGINVDHVPGPRGPVTFRDLHLRQFVVTPA
ncbi:MAG: aldehyde dehydrogenase family protein [Thermoleophilia bacterium]|nr:aldehyde dehydrogenase family protein [Thermoleophilia bacterium]